MSYIVSPFYAEIVNEVISRYDRSQIDIGRHRFIDNADVFIYQKDKLLSYLKREDCLVLICKRDDEISGVIVCENDVFDSSYMGMECYRISELSVFSDIQSDISQIVRFLLTELAQLLSKDNKSNYLLVQLSNNVPGQNFIFNALVDFGFSYIHTLLTFALYKTDDVRYSNSYIMSKGITIRQAKADDAEYVSRIASNSFAYSRFHMDPLLDNSKANALLRDSAINSIRDKYADIVFVAEVNGELAGYYSGKKRSICKSSLIKGEAIISAVDSRYRGLGIFSALDDALIRWFQENVDFAEMGTYLANNPIHRTWINKGLRLINGTHQLSKKL
jgi:GNAT superfamily N-acetyltransferase